MKRLLLTTVLSLYPITAFAGYGQESKLYLRFDIGGGAQQVKEILSSKGVPTGTSAFNAESSTEGHGLAGSVGVGYYLVDEIRFEASFYFDKGLRAKAKTKTTSSPTQDLILRAREKTLATFGTAYYDFLNNSAITPYLAGGVGLLRNEFEHKLASITGSSETKVKKAHFTYGYSFGAGAAYHLASNTDIDFGYKYIRSSNKKNAKSGLSKNTFSVYDVNSDTDILAKFGPKHIVTIGYRSTF